MSKQTSASGQRWRWEWTVPSCLIFLVCWLGLQGLRLGSLGLLLVETELELGLRGSICSVRVRPSSSQACDAALDAPLLPTALGVCSLPPQKKDLTLWKDSAMSGWRLGFKAKKLGEFPAARDGGWIVLI